MGQLDHMFGLVHVHQTVVNLGRCQYSTHWDGPISQPLGDIHHVWFNPEGVGAKGCAYPAEASNDFVKDQQDIVFITDISQPLQISLGGYDDPGRP